MAEDARVGELLEQALDLGLTPEVVCAHCPELAPEVRRRWERCRALDGELMALFPSSADLDRAAGAGPRRWEASERLPSIPGYDVVSILGHGGMGVVYKARHHALKRFVAVKMLLSGAYANANERARFRREAEALARLAHPHVVQVFDVGELEGRPYFTMELLEGGNLAGALGNIPQPAAESAEMIRTLAGAIESAHRSGIVHRDLKPANILLAPDGTPKVTDFGLAREVESTDLVTLSGTRVGTPSYMAPEQASKRWGEVGPPADVYALGAILYEMMTGRPPFRGESVADTERQLIHNDPAMPSQLNAAVPRDLETICLKCLRKAPGARYASAAALAEDLGRFQRGEPILARRVGLLERAIKWARRRPAAATMVAATIVIVALAIGFAVSFDRVRSAHRADIAMRQGRARQAIETSLALVGNLQQDERWTEAGHLLDDAATHLPDAGSPELAAALAAAQRDQRTAVALERVREGHLGSLNPYEEADKDYARTFADAGVDVEGAPGAAAERVRGSPIRQRLLAALDDWAFMIYELKRDAPGRQHLARELLALARRVDPDPAWRDRFRDLADWGDAAKLAGLARDAASQPTPPPPHQLAILVALEQSIEAKLDLLSPLRDAQRRSPWDFRTNWQLGHLLRALGSASEAVGFDRAALALRPDNVDARDELSLALYGCGRTDEAIDVIHCGLDISPHSDWLRSVLVLELADQGRWREARREYRAAVESDPASGAPETSRVMASALRAAGRRDEERGVLLAILSHDPADVGARYGLAKNYLDAGHPDQAVPLLRDLAKNRPNVAEYHMRLGEALTAAHRPDQAIAEFRAAADPAPKDRAAHYGLGVALAETGKLDEALDALQAAADLDPKQAATWGWIAKVRLRQFRLAEARDAAKRQLACLPPDLQPAVRRRIEICGLLANVDLSQPGVLDGRQPPEDPKVRAALAELLYRYARRPIAAARIYESLSRADAPVHPDDLYPAACAAAMASCGMGDDPEKLDAPARAHFRSRALDWLAADHGAWAAMEGKPGARHDVAVAMRARLESDELAGVRDPTALAALPPEERARWRSLWADTRALAERDPRAKVDQARAAAAHRGWSAAASLYSQAVDLDPDLDSDVWFELAAVRRLSGDESGYREATRTMAQRPTVRGYHLARALTLAPQSVEDLTRAEKASKAELEAASSQFWALTEQAALECRMGRPAVALGLIQRSCRANPRPGALVVNWLWEAMAEQTLGHTPEARELLGRATHWLDDQGPDRPPDTDKLGLHLHNWLEAQILLRELEVRTRLPPASRPGRESEGPGVAR